MSGFAGILHLNQAPVGESALHRARHAACWGKDAGVQTQQIGAARQGCVAFVSASESGPSVTHDGDVWALCDGRIDNAEELAPLCEAAGFGKSPSNSYSTAQQVLAAYAKWGVDCAPHLLGDFVFVLWDLGARRLLCARDPAQTRLLYYVLDGKSLRFSSDLRALLDEPDVSRDFDPVYLATYAVMSSLNWERTPYAAIRQLPGGHTMIVENGIVRTPRWWHLPEPGTLRFKHESEYHEHLRALLHEAVRVRLRSDSPVSITLSRGVDSAVIAASAAHLVRQNQAPCPSIECVTFSSRRHPEADESGDASDIAKYLGLPHRIIEPSEDAGDFGERIGSLAEPSGMVTHWNEWLSVRRACEESGSRVLLTGIGGELFESPFLYLADLARERRWPTLGREMWRWKQAGASVSSAARATLRGLQEPPFHWQPRQKLPFYPWLRDVAHCETNWASLSRQHPVAQSDYHNFVERGAATIGLQPLFSSAQVEVRNPLCDRRLIEFACAVPIERKLRRAMADGRLMNKPLLRHAVQSELPFSLTKPSKPLRAQMGASFQRHHHHVRELLDELPRGLEEILETVFDLRVLREHLHQLQQDNGSKRYVALTSLLLCWLSHSQRSGRYRRIAEPTPQLKEVIS